MSAAPYMAAYRRARRRLGVRRLADLVGRRVRLVRPIVLLRGACWPAGSEWIVEAAAGGSSSRPLGLSLRRAGAGPVPRLYAATAEDVEIVPPVRAERRNA